ncbi:hypothetical protein HMPREF9629_00459 [Peptoanaerobacter stomatis]|uniref:Uncharacterized protein n=1 Tax=Peptoanaerobacter stomatis TaxID=796937 RepID=G9X236_9FIRM|nr:hypothetical protein [Peptoanaerobacter stomatis]EHL13159.1 hypothetical protein HMPREF9629_00459 [Peptoanaerobacter stomatis]
MKIFRLLRLLRIRKMLQRGVYQMLTFIKKLIQKRKKQKNGKGSLN